MGLFSRNHSHGKDADNLFNDDDLPRSEDLDESFLDTENLDKSTTEKPKKLSVSTLRYGIEDAIALMRKLPKDDTEVVVTVVNKTLESTHIKVADIIQDATDKETRLREQHKQLEVEIKGLQREIELRNKQITELQTDLKETSEVSQCLKLAVEIEKKASTSTPKTDTTTKAAGKAAEPTKKVAPSTPPTTPAQPKPTPRPGERSNTKH